MRELNNGLKVIGTDLGYGNIKTANTVTPTGITVYDTEPIFQGISLNVTASITASAKITKNLSLTSPWTMIFISSILWRLRVNYSAQAHMTQRYILRQAYPSLGYAHSATASKRTL